MPKGLKMKKFIEGPDGTLIHDSSYVGEDAWEDDATTSKDKVMEIIDHDVSLNTEDKRDLQEELGLSDVNQESRGTWQERLQIWKEILRKEQLAEQLDSSRSRYAIEFDMEEVEKSFREDARVKAEGTEGARALWISKRWWRYRPKLPYTYFLEKLDCSEVNYLISSSSLSSYTSQFSGTFRHSESINYTSSLWCCTDALKRLFLLHLDPQKKKEKRE